METTLSTRRAWGAFAAAALATLLTTAFGGTVIILRLLAGWCVEAQDAASCSAEQHRAAAGATWYGLGLALVSVLIVAVVTAVALGGRRSPVRGRRIVLLAAIMVLASPFTAAAFAAVVRTVAPGPVAPLLVVGLVLDGLLLAGWRRLLRASA
jgi:hypothetical protein